MSFKKYCAMILLVIIPLLVLFFWVPSAIADLGLSELGTFAVIAGTAVVMAWITIQWIQFLVKRIL